MGTLFGSLGSGSAAVAMALLRCGVRFCEAGASTWEADSALAGLRAANPMHQNPDAGGRWWHEQGGAVGALDLLAAVVSRWPGARAHLTHRRRALLAALQAVVAQPDLQPVFRRHWPPTPT